MYSGLQAAQVIYDRPLLL